MHKKQTGGVGQIARVICELNLVPANADGEYMNQFVNKVRGGSILDGYVLSVEKAFYKCVKKGSFTG